jgi:hypothetical protein
MRDMSVASTSSPAGLTPRSIHATRSSNACLRIGPSNAQMARAPQHALHEEVIRPGHDGAAPIRLLEAQGNPRITHLVQREERHRQPSRPLRVDAIRGR